MGRGTNGYIESDSEIVAAIKRGLEDIAAGRTIPHEEVMRQIRNRIERVASAAPNKHPSP